MRRDIRKKRKENTSKWTVLEKNKSLYNWFNTVGYYKLLKWHFLKKHLERKKESHQNILNLIWKKRIKPNCRICKPICQNRCIKRRTAHVRKLVRSARSFCLPAGGAWSFTSWTGAVLMNTWTAAQGWGLLERLFRRRCACITATALSSVHISQRVEEKSAVLLLAGRNTRHSGQSPYVRIINQPCIELWLRPHLEKTHKHPSKNWTHDILWDHLESFSAPV